MLIPPDQDKAIGVVCAIIEASGGEFRGKTQLNQVFWRAHVHHYRHHAGLLSRYPIARLPEGPAIAHADALIADMERQGRVHVGVELKGDHPEYVFTLQAKRRGQLNADEADSINAAAAWIRGKTASQASKESQQLSRGWRHGKDGEIIDYANDALTAEEADRIEREVDAMSNHLERAKGLVADAFGSSGPFRQIV